LRRGFAGAEGRRSLKKKTFPHIIRRRISGSWKEQEVGWEETEGGDFLPRVGNGGEQEGDSSNRKVLLHG